MNQLLAGLLLAAALFGVGLWGVIARRNLLLVLVALEVMLNAGVVALVAFARYFAGYAGAPGTDGAAVGHAGQLFALYVLALAAAEAAVGLAILLAFARRRGTLDARAATELKG